MRPLLRSLLLATSASLAACTSTTETQPDQDALSAAAQFQSLADSASRAGANPDVTSAYRDIAATLGRNGRVSPVTITIDGAPREFLATAQQLEIEASPACTGPLVFCATPAPLRSVVAFERSNPRRVVQVVASPGAAGIGSSTVGSLSTTVVGISGLTYFDGSGGAYMGTSGTQSIADPVTSDTPCYSSAQPGTGSVPALVRCTLAEFTASFSGVLAPPPFVIAGNTAAGTHTIAMASQPVHGARLVLLAAAIGCPVCGAYPPTVLPPVNLQGGALRATMTASATSSLVTLELRVTNPQTQPVTVQFSSSQQYDFRVRRLDGSTVWLWSADKGFTQALTSRTLAAGETALYSATWTPTEKGSFVAEGRLTSTSHPTGSAIGFSVP